MSSVNARNLSSVSAFFSTHIQKGAAASAARQSASSPSVNPPITERMTAVRATSSRKLSSKRRKDMSSRLHLPSVGASRADRLTGMPAPRSLRARRIALSERVRTSTTISSYVHLLTERVAPESSVTSTRSAKSSFMRRTTASVSVSLAGTRSRVAESRTLYGSEKSTLSPERSALPVRTISTLPSFEGSSSTANIPLPA